MQICVALHVADDVLNKLRPWVRAGHTRPLSPHQLRRSTRHVGSELRLDYSRLLRKHIHLSLMELIFPKAGDSHLCAINPSLAIQRTLVFSLTAGHLNWRWYLFSVLIHTLKNIYTWGPEAKVKVTSEMSLWAVSCCHYSAVNTGVPATPAPSRLELPPIAFIHVLVSSHVFCLWILLV